MNLKHLTKSMILVLTALLLVLVIQQVAVAKSSGMSVLAFAEKGSEKIIVSGHTTSNITDVTFRIKSPSGYNVVEVGQVSPDENGDFVKEFKIGPTWTENGFYKVTVMQSVHGNSLYTMSVHVEINDGMAEETLVTESNLETGIFEPHPSIIKDRGLEIEAELLIGSNEITITGTTDKLSQDVTLTVTAPNANVVFVAQVSPSVNGGFTVTITTGGPLWGEDAFYTVTAQQNEDPEYITSVHVSNGCGVALVSGVSECFRW